MKASNEEQGEAGLPWDGFSADALKAFVAEDVGDGDWTTLWTIPDEAVARARIVAKAPVTISGIADAEAVFRLLDPHVRIERHTGDGQTHASGDVLLVLEGKTRALLMAERTALNILGRLSGIATLTRQFVRAAESLKGGARILDTRKTTPGWRQAEKRAVVHGGGHNHRVGLYDMVLLKENHIAAAGGILEAVDRVRSENHRGLAVEVEVRSLEELLLLKGHDGVQRILLDNFTIEATAAAVDMVKGWPHPRPELEASGNMSLERVQAVSATGVDCISVGALTHSAPVADLSLLLEPLARAQQEVGEAQRNDVDPWHTKSHEEWARVLGVPQFEVLDQVGSTNDRMRALAGAGAPPFSVSVALEQTEGRGREGRTWDSERAGGLWMSVLLPLPSGGPPGVTPLAVGVACALALEACGVQGVQLKWPNDLVLDQGKLGGILCEVVPGGVVVGIGINVDGTGEGGRAMEPGSPDDALPRRQANQGQNPPVTAPELTRVIVQELRRWADPPADRLEGALREVWEMRDVLFGHDVVVQGGGADPRVRRGRVCGVSDSGALRIDDAGAVVEVISGRVRLEHPRIPETTPS